MQKGEGERRKRWSRILLPLCFLNAFSTPTFFAFSVKHLSPSFQPLPSVASTISAFQDSEPKQSKHLGRLGSRLLSCAEAKKGPGFGDLGNRFSYQRLLRRKTIPAYQQAQHREYRGRASPVVMLRSCLRPLEWCLGRISGADGLLWDVDLKPHTSGEFSIAVVQANSSLEDQGQVVNSPFATFVGVYDGHGGPEASRFVSNRLLPYVESFASEEGGLSVEVIKKAFDATEKDFLHLVKRSWLLRPQIASVGSCCLVGAIAGDALYVANLGDSRAVLGRRGFDGRGAVAQRLSTDHNVSVEEVRKEVAALHPDDKQIVVHTRGAWRIKGIIQVSRSIGDIYLKKPEFSKDPLFQQLVSPLPLKRPVITAEPSIRVHKLKPHDLFLIFASDGLWEQLSDEAAVDIVFKNPRAGIAKRLVRAALNEAARKKETRYDDIKQIGKGIRRHFHDDITVIVVYLDQHRQGGHSGFNSSNHNCTSAPVDIFSFNTDGAEDPLGPVESMQSADLLV